MESNGHRRAKRYDCVIKENGDSHLSNDDEHDPWTAWAYKPRTITLLLIGAGFLM
jgi:phosphatidylserine synthase 2